MALKTKNSFPDSYKSFDLLDNIIYIIDSNHKIIFINKFGSSFFKKNAHSLLGKACYKVFFNQDKSCAICKKDNASKQKIIGSKYFSVEIKKLKHSTKVYYLHILHDITQLKKTEKKLLNNELLLKNQNKEYLLLNEELIESSEHLYNINKQLESSQTRYRELFDKMHNCVVVYEATENGKDFIIKDINYRACRTEKVKKEQVIGLSITQFILRAQEFGILKLLQRVNKTSKSEFYPAFFYQDIRIKGWREIYAYKLPTGEIVSVYDDVSERITQENQLKEKHQQLKWAIEASNDALWDYDLKSETIYISKRWYAMLGYKPKESFININTWLSFIHDEDKESTLKAIENSIKKRKYTIFIEYRMKAKDNSWKWILCKGKAVTFDNRNKALRFIGTNTDITEIKEYQQQLIDSKNKAEESDRLKSAFLANMSHEIRTPMNGIIGFSELLERPTISDQNRKKFTTIIRNRSIELLHIINDILDISKIEAGQLQISYKEFNLNEIIEDLYSLEKEKINQEKKQIILKYSKFFENDKSYIISDNFRLKQILTNLIDNAIKFTDEGYVEFGYELKDNELIFHVKDTGIGIKPSEQKKIFERFIQADISLTRKYSGAGLGLSICKGILKLLHGKIWVESELEKGSCFYFSIPYKSYHPINKNTTISIEQLKNNNWVNYNFLIIEDDKTCREYLYELLKPTKANLIFADTGKLGLQIFNSEKQIDLVLLDILLPDFSGLDIVTMLKKINPSVPVIAQTAFAMENERTKCLDKGCNDYISKPIDKEILFQKISTLLKKNILEQEAEKCIN